MKIVNSLKGLKNNFIFSLSVSWKASKVFLSIRILIEMFLAIQPILQLYLGKRLLDIIAGGLYNRELAAQKAVYTVAAVFALETLGLIIFRINEIIKSIHNDKISNFIKVQTMEKTKALDLAFFDSPDFYNLLQLAQRDSGALQVFSWLSLGIIKSAIQLISTSVILIRLHWLFPIMIILLSIPSIIMEKKFVDHLYNWGINKVPEERKMNYITGILTGREYAKEVRLFNIFDDLFHRYDSYWKSWFQEKVKITKKKSVWVSVLPVLPQAGVTFITAYVTFRIIRRTSTIGDYSLYTGAAAQLLGAITSLITVISNIYDNGLRIENYKKFININSTSEKGGCRDLEEDISIEFKDVTFIYPNTTKKILDKISFKIDHRQKVAIVGLNGEGKSTIVKLILRFYDPTEGEILINGCNIKEYDLVKLRKAFGVIFQDYSNYAFTLRENITISELGKKEDEERILKACQEAGMDNMLEKWNTGLDTYLTKRFEENGEELSGGEWQKVALARTFFKSSRFIIMDEPTAALDPEAEHRLYKKIARLCKDKSAIFISHRLSSVIITDKILVLKNGKIVEEGSHKELMKQGGIYYYLFNLQSEKYRIEEVREQF